jgi:starch phosphorylase
MIDASDKNKIKRRFEDNLKSHYGRTVKDAGKKQLYKACALTLRDEIMENWVESEKKTADNRQKQLYYLSIEFLTGRALRNNLINSLQEKAYSEAFREMGIDPDELVELEPDAGLGNGGLGRLAACFLDSLATLDLPGHGFGLRYQYGMFKQKIVDGYQLEMPDLWLEDGNVWEIPRPEEQKEVRFGGRVVETVENGRTVYKHTDYITVLAVPYDTPIVGYGAKRVNTLRLWSAKSAKNLDMGLFGRGDYLKASAEKELAEVISKVLYPDDNHYEGKALRLKQHYFFVSASVQCIVENFKKRYGDFKLFPDKVAIHINDTHPALAIPELMRILVDEEGLDWDTAWDITVKTFAYTNHTIMGEALERWPENLFKEQLPRIHMIVREINERYCRSLWNHYPGQWDKIAQMAIVAYGEVRMAPLCIVGTRSVNGVSPLHTSILKNDVFKEYNRLEPHKFINITNGITQRRWLLLSNPELASLLNETIGESWVTEPWRLKDLEPFAEDAAFREAYAKVKANNKKRLAKYIQEHNRIDVDTDSIFDVQVKRLHEYKRQLLNILHIMHLYTELLYNPGADIHPRTFIFGGKASPGYHRAKLIIKLINTVADKINRDKKISEILKVVFLEDYRVTLAEKIIPAADVSEQISTAGKEASGTGNMKFMLNGALTVGTMDGANIEIYKAVGEDNMFIFGLNADEVKSMQMHGTYDPQTLYRENHRIKLVLNQLVNGFLVPEDTNLFAEIYRSLLYGEHGNPADPYMVLADFKSYARTQEKIGRTYKDKDAWFKKAVINTANAGYFSSDRSIREYNSAVWNL